MEGENGELAEKVEANDDVQLYWSKLAVNMPAEVAENY